MRLPANKSVCLVHTNFSSVSETFVRRHVAELNDGRTVVVQFGALDRELHRPVFQLVVPRLGKQRFPWSQVPVLPQPDPEQLEQLSSFAAAQDVGIFLCEFGPVGLQFYRYALRLGLPIYCYFRGYDASKLIRQRAYRQQLAEMFEQIDGIVGVSAYLLNRLSQRGLTHANSLVVPSGVDTSAFEPAQKDATLVVSVGRLVEKKSPLTTIRAFANVARRHPQLRLEMIGDGWLRKRVVRLVERLGIADRVILHGSQDHAFVTERLRRAGIFLQHSVTSLSGDTEGAPTAIQEAMTAGCAVVTTRHAGIPELISHGETGLMVRERDQSGYADALRSVVEDAALRERLGNAAREHALTRFDYRRLYAQLEHALAATVENRRAATTA